jgi:membrane protein required for colicin V production
MALFKGLRKGLIVALFSFVGFVIGLAAAVKLSAVAASYIERTVEVSGRWLPFLAFMAVFVLVVILVRLGAKLVEGAAGLMMLGWVNKIGGVILYALIYLFIFSLILFYGLQLRVIKMETAEASVLYPFIQPLAPAIMDFLGMILPFFRNMFDELLQFFDGVPAANEKLG